MENISVIAIYSDDKTSQSGLKSLEESLVLFESFPWKDEFEKSKTTGINPVISIVARQDQDSYLNILLDENGLFDLEIMIACKKNFLNALFKKPLTKKLEGIHKEWVPEYIRKFFRLNCDELYQEFEGS